MAMELLNGSLKIEIFYDRRDKEYEDNICLSIKEIGPEEEKVFYAGETNLYIKPEDARKLADMLLEAADHSSHATR
ncbi:MAG: hypothetical protein FJZ98_02995 [Chloroflexi bacterium]|nr:hypothetical protein [Chloroflexota bacterium]